MSRDIKTSLSPSTTERHIIKFQRLLYIPLVIIIPTGIYTTYQLSLYYDKRQSYLPRSTNNAHYPNIHDLYYVALFTILYILVRLLVVPLLFKPLGNYILPAIQQKHGKWTQQIRSDKIDRFSQCSFKLLHFISIVIFGYHTLNNTSYLPSVLGGHGTVQKCFDAQYPYHSASNELRYYVLLQFSYHLHSMIMHTFSQRRNDYIEMMVHHSAAVFLVLFGWLHHLVRIAMLVAFTHDIADIFAYAVKCSVDTVHTKLTFAIYCGLMATWGYTRLYVYPVHLISAVITEPQKVFPPDEYCSVCWNVFIFMLCTLQLLHIYWYSLFIVMGKRFIKDGATVDIQQKVGELDDDTIYTNGSIKQNNRNKMLYTNGLTNGLNKNCSKIE